MAKLKHCTSSKHLPSAPSDMHRDKHCSSPHEQGDRPRSVTEILVWVISVQADQYFRENFGPSDQNYRNYWSVSENSSPGTDQLDQGRI